MNTFLFTPAVVSKLIAKSSGKLIFHIFGALAEFERNLIRERTQAGLQAARARGRRRGRPKALTANKVQMAQQLYNDKTNAIADICKTLNISRATLYLSEEGTSPPWYAEAGSGVAPNPAGVK